ncbi:MAG: endonuclease MutS2 [Bacteroidetes bacterium]|nr:endonuclease MutS2 [Bacteroidota bacterium]
MNLFPVESASKLGFDVVLDWLVQRVAGEATLRSSSDIRSFNSVDAVVHELRLVDELQQCLKFDDPIGFREFDDVRSPLARASLKGAALEALDLYAIARVMELFDSIKSYFSARKAKYPLVDGSFSTIVMQGDAKKLILSSIDESGDVLDAASSELKRIRRELVQTRNRVREAAMKALAYASSQGFAADDQPTVRGGRLVIPIRAEAKRKISGFVHDVSASGQTVYIEPESALIGNNEVRELEAEEQREILAIRVRLTDSIRDSLPEIKAAYGQLTRFDLQWAKARLGNVISGTVPEVKIEGLIRITEGRNPALVLHFLKEGGTRSVVPFALELGAENTVLIISGPNAGGKSVTMKSVGLLALMLAHGIPIPVGENARFDLFDSLFVDIGDEQSLADDLSTFTSHLKTLGLILSEANEQSLVLIDEAGTGTDPEAGGALARATFEQLLANRVRTIATTHFGPLKVFAHETDGVMNASMVFDQEELKPTYQFVTGVPGSSYAAEIALRVGLPESIIARVKELSGSGHVKAENLIADLMTRNALLAETLKNTEALKAQLETQRDSLANKLAILQEERGSIRAEALRKAEAVYETANKSIEQAIREIKESAASKAVTVSSRKNLEEAKSILQKEIQRSTKKKQGRRKSSGDLSELHIPIRIGDRVRMDEAETIGEIADLEGKTAVVAYGSMQMKIELSRLVRIGGKAKQEVKVRQSLGSDGRLSIQSVKTRLDIRGQRVDEAFSLIVRFLDQGLGAGVQRLEILHGTGTGALRKALHEYLDSANGILRYEEAPLSEGGAGVTHIYF